MVNDSKRRAADALIEAVNDGFTFREILELAIDDNTASDRAYEYLSRVHDVYTGNGIRGEGEPEHGQ
ncbi:MAG: hypothetical protein KJN60_10100 [Boseongicola sp.]|nr:hypothetical protein [Boseongicola sp.]